MADWTNSVGAHSDCPPKTKRLVVGQVTIRGCCCGNTERGLPEGPIPGFTNRFLWSVTGTPSTLEACWSDSPCSERALISTEALAGIETSRSPV